jgi:hypothetical protein
MVIRAWQAIVTRAIQARASDIHVEAFEYKTVIRIRVDGIRNFRSAVINVYSKFR